MKKLGGVYFILFVLLVLILVNFIGSFQFFRVDLTEEKIHSLSPKTIEILKSDSLIEDELKFEIYLEGDLPPNLRKVQLAIREKLDEFRAYGGDKIYYEFINPSENIERRDEIQAQLEEFGLNYTIVSSYSNNSNKNMKIYGGIVIRAPGNKISIVQFISPSAIPIPSERIDVNNIIVDLEYKLIEGVNKILVEGKKKIGFLQGHGELQENEVISVAEELKKNFLVENVTINGKIKALDKIDALVVAKPTQPISNKDQYVIDQFIMKGGKVAWLIDVVGVDEDSLMIRRESLGLDLDLNRIDQQIFNYGVRINKNLLKDGVCAPLYLNRNLYYDWFYYPEIQTYRAKNIIVNNVNPIRLQYASTLDVLNNKGVKAEKLLFSSDLSRVSNTPARINLVELLDEPESLRAYSTPFNVVGVMLEGKFKSHFRNRMTSKFLEESGFDQKNESILTKMLVISDGDIIRNMVDSVRGRSGKLFPRAYNIGRHPYDVSNLDRIEYGNKEFFVNAMESLLGTQSLVSIRSRVIKNRQLNNAKVVAEKSYWQILNALIPILVVLTFGLFHFMLRRKKFTS